MTRGKKSNLYLIVVATIMAILLPFTNSIAYGDDNGSSTVIDFTDTAKLDSSKNTIDIVSFNDFHGSIVESGKNIGIAKLTSIVKQYESKESDSYGVIPLCAGDSYQGSAISNLEYGEPINKAYKEINLVASAIGNHEYDWGNNNFSKWQNDGDFSFLAANIINKDSKEPVSYAKPYIMLQKNNIKIAIIGISTPKTKTSTKSENVEDVEFLDPVETLEKYSKIVKDQGADVVVALTHCGAYQDETTGEITGEAADIAKSVKGIDAIVSGHSHTFISGKVNNIPIVQGGYNGRAIGKLRFTFNSQKQIESIEPSCIQFAGKEGNINEDENVKSIVNKYQEQLKPLFAQKVTTLNEDLDNEDKFTSLTPLGISISETMRKVANTDICINNGGCFRKSLKKGDITVGDMYELMPFDNYIITLNLKGSDLKKVLEYGINMNDHAWGQFAGVTVYYNNDSKEITSMKLSDGNYVDMNKEYSVAINDFMLTCGDGYDFEAATNVLNTNICMRDSIKDYMKNNGVQYSKATALIFGEEKKEDGTITPIKDTTISPSSDDNSNVEQNASSKKTSDNTTYLYVIFTSCAFCLIASSKKKISSRKAS